MISSAILETLPWPSESRYLTFVSLSCVSAGNVLLALWTVEQNQLSDIITLVAKCSLEIQEKFGIYHTREGQDLQLQIGSSYQNRLAWGCIGSYWPEPGLKLVFPDSHFIFTFSFFLLFFIFTGHFLLFLFYLCYFILPVLLGSIYLRYTTWCSDVGTHCELISTMKLINMVYHITFWPFSFIKKKREREI